MRLLFVYNAGSGLFDALTGSAHKLLAPHTYECRLCLYTHGTFGALRPWRDYLQGLPHELAFYHRDEFFRAYPEHARTALPAILAERDGALETVLAAPAIDGAGSLQGLVERLDAALARYPV